MTRTLHKQRCGVEWLRVGDIVAARDGNLRTVTAITSAGPCHLRLWRFDYDDGTTSGWLNRATMHDRRVTTRTRHDVLHPTQPPPPPQTQRNSAATMTDNNGRKEQR